MKALLLCAGEGTRLRPLTLKLAKPAVPVLNVPMWGYPLQLIESLHPSELHVNLHHLPETVKESFKKHSGFDYPIQFHFEEELLGSAGPLTHLLKSGKRDAQDILLANGDAVMITRHSRLLQEMMASHQESKSLATILAVPQDGAGVEFSGVWFDRNNQLTGIGTSAPTVDSKPLHYASIILLSPKIFDFWTADARNIFNDVLIPAALKKEKVRIFASSDLLFYETGNLKGLSRAHVELLSLLKNNSSEWNIIDILDRFQPGWRNYQKGNVFRERPLKGIQFENLEDHLTLIARDFRGKDVDPKRVVRIKGPSGVCGFNDQTLPSELDGIYWGHIRSALLNSGELIEI